MSNEFAERRWTSRDGLSLYLRDYPAKGGEQRLPVICLHGLTRNSKDFEDVAPLIGGMGRRVIVPDVRGRGLSDRDPNPANYQPKVYARDVRGMMKDLGINRAVFLGTSMGGLIAMTLAAADSKRVAAAILNDVGPRLHPKALPEYLATPARARRSRIGMMPSTISSESTADSFQISHSTSGGVLQGAPSAKSGASRPWTTIQRSPEC